MIRRVLLLILAIVGCNAAAFAQTCPSSVSWCSGTYAYDAMGNIRAIGADTYVYDTAGRLVSGTADVQRTGVVSRQDYSYDAFGNRTGASRIAGSVGCPGGCELSPAIDPLTNHITGSGAHYDDAGNLQFIQGPPDATYTYDAAGSLVRSIAGTDDRQFIYTADDERIATANGANGATWTWTVRGLDGKVLREFTSLQAPGGLPTSSWKWTKDYVWRDGLLLASVTPTASGGTATQHFHLDHLGTPRLVTGDNGVQLSVHAYYPFGAELNITPAELMKFTGHERDLLVNDPHTLDYMHARYEMGAVGRFLSIDPLISKGSVSKPQMWNRYAYAINNPIGNSDPTGKDVSIGVSFTGDGWTDEQKKRLLAHVRLWYASKDVGSVYVFDSAKQKHGRFFGSLLRGHANIEVSMGTGNAHKPDLVFAGSIFSDRSLTSAQQLQAIGNAIVHETAAHQFHSTYVEAQDQLWYVRESNGAQHDASLQARYGTVADSYAFVWPDTKPNVTNGPIPIHPDDLRALQHNLRRAHAEPPENRQ